MAIVSHERVTLNTKSVVLVKKPIYVQYPWIIITMESGVEIQLDCFTDEADRDEFYDVIVTHM